MPKAEDLTGKIFNNWRVEGKAEGRKYKCTCLICNNQYDVIGYKLKNNQSKSCVNCASKIKAKQKVIIPEGTKINNWTIISYNNNGTYKCKCLCGNVKDITTYNLTSHRANQCKECANKELSENNREKLETKTFGNIYIDSHIDKDLYLCKCSCGNTFQAHAYAIKHNKLQMCKVCREKILSTNYRKTMFERYNEISAHRIKSPREEWKILTLNNKDELIKYIDILENNIGRKPTSYEVAQALDISIHILLKHTREYRINLNNGNISQCEINVRNLITKNEALYNNRQAIYPCELDIYIPDINTAIEVDGSYWHSDIYKHKMYHQEKTLLCKQENIRLIHIFEYELADNNKRIKIENFIKNIDNHCKIKLYARNLKIKTVNKEDEKEFLNRYHLQNYTNSNICIGLYNNTELISLMSFGKPRFTSKYQYELIRYCTKDSYYIVGGAERIFKHFITSYEVNSIISYCDISKFTGEVYKRLGFNTSEDMLTNPNYVWVNSSNEVIPRYKTQKQRLINKGLGNIEQTEDEIMKSLGYYKIYDCGNQIYTWNKDIANKI